MAKLRRLLPHIHKAVVAVDSDTFLNNRELVCKVIGAMELSQAQCPCVHVIEPHEDSVIVHKGHETQFGGGPAQYWDRVSEKLFDLEG